MPWTVDNNFDDVLAGIKSDALALAAATGDRITDTVPCDLDGHQVWARCSLVVNQGRLTHKVVWYIDGKRRGYNHLRGILRKGSALRFVPPRQETHEVVLSILRGS